MEKGEAVAIGAPDDVLPHRQRVFINANAMETVHHRIQAEADTVEGHDLADGIKHFKEKARAVFMAAAVLVIAQVGLPREELVEQVSVGRMNFDSVESGGHGIGGSLPEIGDAFGGRDHTTVLHACRVMKELRASQQRLNEDYSNLLRTLAG